VDGSALAHCKTAPLVYMSKVSKVYTSRTVGTFVCISGTKWTIFGVACSSVRRHTMAGQCGSGVPRSIKRRSLTVLPDAAVLEFGLEAEDPAFADQVGEVTTWASSCSVSGPPPNRPTPKLNKGVCSSVRQRMD
jgi:hypothetical protein